MAFISYSYANTYNVYINLKTISFDIIDNVKWKDEPIPEFKERT